MQSTQTAVTQTTTATYRSGFEMQRRLEDIHDQELQAHGAEMALFQVIQSLRTQAGKPGMDEAIVLAEQLREQWQKLHADLRARWAEVFSQWAS